MSIVSCFKKIIYNTRGNHIESPFCKGGFRGKYSGDIL